MIRVSKLIILLVALTISASLNAVHIEIAPTVSKAIIKVDDDRLKDDKVLYGLRGNVYLNKNVAVQVGAEASTSNEMSDGGKTDIERVFVNMVYDAHVSKKITPYTIVGGGYEKVHRVINSKDSTQPFLNIGAGLKFDITDRVKLMTEAKWMKKLENNDDDIIATVGLGVKFGKTARKTCNNIPSVTQTTEAQNAISLAEFRKIQEAKKVTKNVVSTITPVAVVSTVASSDSLFVDESTIPSDAIIIGENDSETVSYVQTSDTTSYIEPMPMEEAVDEPIPSDDGYYIQLAAIFGGATPVALTDRLESKNYHYITKDVQRFGKNASLVLVGPYVSRTEAGIALNYLRRLKSDAFIYHIN